MDGATKDYQPLHQLSEPKLRALGALSGGATHEEAARQAGVHRVTVSRWASRDPEFMAERQRRRETVAAEAADRAAEVMARALGVVHDRLVDGDVAVALAVLRSSGGLLALVRSPEAVRDPTDDLRVTQVETRMAASLKERLRSVS